MTILLSFFFLYNYIESTHTYVKLFLTREKTYPYTLRPHVFFDQKVVAYDQGGFAYIPEDARYPAVWARAWINGHPLLMKKYTSAQAAEAGHLVSRHSKYAWFSNLYEGSGELHKQAEFVVLPAEDTQKIDEYICILNWQSDRPIEEVTFTMDLGTIIMAIPGIGKQNSPYYVQWLYGTFFRLEPPGYQRVGNTVSWRWSKIPRIDEKIHIQWYAWYR
ncbi:hypothetical protein A7K93_09890 [Candidatus Methylacidiphilum fumarolicum]|uniref:Uncharacterized protein n=1 Tax=Candidatus Methylacidiphilum fumarolicum TaxID=591154 RepID=A0ABN8XGW0_9BACT|nr:hypothetical protein [Candidatus Methylacidiphilum fumarolicum]MBW6414318.1 hypothetical protein [Candidatus Methylacidiphilum fumarolicum]TFE67757.1 hypothetical protein A7K73_08560 [Candidatus Methylacidiphilum fumarolicum]TFE71949.1 hypothetical protein A7K93_09890 [Candidatus Methylacidiphilum fumarolicum]TFE76605.1 hypothetical protein A7D33_09130 [Candidatus Methylacidiphilum fumarolicum]CAI9086199.1 conserved protein of unknown function [Candidatus Methylacidiphilum fumarolicum]